MCNADYVLYRMVKMLFFFFPWLLDTKAIAGLQLFCRLSEMQ